MLNYWVLQETQLRQFEGKWMVSESDQVSTLTPADFSQVTGPSSILERTQKMTLLPFQMKDLSFLVATVLVPFIPVAALVIPLANILHVMLKIVA